MSKPKSHLDKDVSAYWALRMLSSRGDALQTAIDAIDELELRTQGGAPASPGTLAENLDRHREVLVTELRDVAIEASQVPAADIEAIRAKARIWLHRYIPDADDDVIALAESICRDLVAKKSG